MNTLTPVQIARVCHEANRGLQQALLEGGMAGGITLAPVWEVFAVASPEQAEGVIEGVKSALAGATPQELHTSWCGRKRHEGWTYGAVKDEEAKTHPCLVSYFDLPREQRLKDRMFASIVRALNATEFL